MTIIVTGAGSGGHITPVLAVAKALKAKQPGSTVVYVGQTGDNLADVVATEPAIDRTYGVSAGKFRRYHGEGLRQLLDFKTLALNIRDFFRVIRGFWQAYRLLGKERPAVIFVKGGFVGVPVGLAAALRKIPYVTHDSDAIPGLANRIISRWAAQHAVALPKELYHYPADKTVMVGVPTRPEFQLVDEAAQAEAKRQLKLDAKGRVLFVTGGGLGAQRLNTAVASVAGQLLDDIADLTIIHQVGRAHETAVKALYAEKLTPQQQDRVVVLGFATDLYRYSAAADVVVMRAGATAIAEIALQGKAAILVPNPLLTGGHQLKNAQVLQDKAAVMVLSDEVIVKDLPLLLTTVEALLNDKSTRQKLAANLHRMAHPAATDELAAIILEAAKD